MALPSLKELLKWLEGEVDVSLKGDTHLGSKREKGIARFNHTLGKRVEMEREWDGVMNKLSR